MKDEKKLAWCIGAVFVSFGVTGIGMLCNSLWTELAGAFTAVVFMAIGTSISNKMEGE